MSYATRKMQWDRHPADTRSLLQVALDVHGVCTGQADADPEDFKFDVQLLSLAISSWEEGLASHLDFDNAAWYLIHVALVEGTMELAKLRSVRSDKDGGPPTQEA